MFKIIGLILIFIGVFNLFQYNKAQKGNFYVKGTFIDYRYSSALNKYFPVFRYTIDGITYEEEYRGVYKSKEKIEKLKNIDIDEIAEDGTNRGREYIWIGVGVVFLIISYLFEVIKGVF